ncbi:MAG: hypothetical protein JWO38_6172 [Gemmataceae bacterium]|nr:hypothetical protein [Gemmataceae bacterium]
MKCRWRWLILSVAVLGVGSSVWRTIDRLGPEPFPLHHGGDAVSADLAADLRLMWETQPLPGDAGPSAGPNPKGSTDPAIHAASRVFNTVDLVGKTRDEVVAQLGDPRASSDSVYNFPFWPAPSGSLVYRFDTGAYGWQFNVVFGLRGRVTEVQRHWIH